LLGGLNSFVERLEDILGTETEDLLKFIKTKFRIRADKQAYSFEELESAFNNWLLYLNH
jgi:hypothetical protein